MIDNNQISIWIVEAITLIISALTAKILSFKHNNVEPFDFSIDFIVLIFIFLILPVLTFAILLGVIH